MSPWIPPDDCRLPAIAQPAVQCHAEALTDPKALFELLNDLFGFERPQLPPPTLTMLQGGPATIDVATPAATLVVRPPSEDGA